MDGLLVFGDVFRYNEGEYVYLAGTESITYLAKVLPGDVSRNLKLRCERMAMAPTPLANRVESQLLYCFIMLRTAEVAERAAHYGQQGMNDFGLSGLVIRICTLNEEDRTELRNEILASTGVAGELKDLVKALPG